MATSPFSLPVDFAAEQGALDSKKAMIQALLQRAMTPQQGQMISGHYVGPGWGAALLPIAGALAGNRFQEQDAAARKDLMGRYNAGLGTELTKYFQTRTGTPGETLNDQSAEDLLVNDKNPGMLHDGSAADPRRAAVQALTSGYAPLHELGKTDLTELSKEALQDHKLAAAAGMKNRGMSTKEILALAGQDKFDPKTVLEAAMTGDISGMRAAERVSTVNGQIVTGNPGSGFKVGYDARDRFGNVQPLGEGVIGQTNLATGEAKFAPKGTNVNVSPTMKIINTGETELSKTIGKDAGGEFKTARENAQRAYRTKSTLRQMEELDRKGIFTGATGNLATSLSAIASAIGIPVDRNKLANSEAFQQQMAKEVADVLTAGGGIGRSMTDADREAFKKSLPSLLLTTEGRQQVFAMMHSNADADIARAKSFQERLVENPLYKDAAGLLTINPVDTAPGAGVIPPGPASPIPGVGTGGVMSLDDYLKQKRGGR